MEDLVSVIIPMYNAEDTIIPTLHSVLNQSYPTLEILVVNDGSTDLSKEQVEHVMHHFPSKKITLIHQENAGVSAARNKGIELSNGSFIALLDADDRWLPHKIEKQIDILKKHPDIGLLGTLERGQKCKRSKDSALVQDISFEKLLFKNYFSTSSIVIRKNILEKESIFDYTKKYSEDYKMLLLLSKVSRLSILMEELTLYSINQKGLSSHLIQMQKNELLTYIEMVKKKEISWLLFFVVLVFSNLKFLKRIVFRHLSLSV